MALSIERIKLEIAQSSKATQIHKAITQQERIKFHADTTLDVRETEPYRKFLAFVKSLLPDDKFQMAISLMQYPLPTNDVVEGIFNKLSKIFDGRNPAFNYQFSSPEQRADWEMYRQEVLGEPSVWSDKAWEYFKTEINSVLVVDMPTESDPMDKYPQPYFYFIPITSVVSYKVSYKSGLMDWLIYKDEDRVFVIDDMSYRVFTIDEKNQLGELLSENFHGLPCCPARFFWQEPLSLSDPDIKKSPLSKELSALDWYLFSIISKKHLDLYAKYPIYSGYERECDFTNPEGDVCEKGFLKDINGNYKVDFNGDPIPCPICNAHKNIAGAGSYIEIPVPEDGQPDLRNPIQMLSIDKNSLEYNDAELAAQEKRIISKCVGVDNSILNEVSLADKQVDASFESQEVVLNRIKKGFESAQQFVDSTICQLRYGDAFVSAHINYGTEFYTLTPEVLQSRYTKAKESGASEAELDALKQQMLETSYRHNPVVLQRMLILNELEPFRHLTNEEVKGLYDKGLIDADTLLLKSDFLGYVRRFERENNNILEFGSKMPFSDKINTIYQTLKDYANERRREVNFGGNEE